MIRAASILPLLMIASACGERAAAPEPLASATAGSPALTTASSPATATPEAEAPKPPEFAVPARFTALGTEPFWAAKVAGDRLTYLTPEDQAGQAIAVVRRTGADFVELGGTLAGQRLTLRLTAGPCSDGMSDVVYPFSVRRRLGADEQRGCARIDPRETTQGGTQP